MSDDDKSCAPIFDSLVDMLNATNETLNNTGATLDRTCEVIIADRRTATVDVKRYADTIQEFAKLSVASNQQLEKRIDEQGKRFTQQAVRFEAVTTDYLENQKIQTGKIEAVLIELCKISVATNHIEDIRKDVHSHDTDIQLLKQSQASNNNEYNTKFDWLFKFGGWSLAIVGTIIAVFNYVKGIK